MRVSEIVTGDWHTFALFGDGSVKCWGGNSSGQLGIGDTENRSTPMDFTALSGVVQVAAGSAHTCARLANGRLYCWGFNLYGQLGDGTTTHANAPVAVDQGTGIGNVWCGGGFSCSLSSHKGTVRCWGQGASGQLGNGFWVNSNVPSTVTP